ncbi:MAG TPA: DUF5946 family protein [Bryobacteraceae bacterium]|nr:DUF5946 family protein [Bryobacteraceae bacterium]
MANVIGSSPAVPIVCGECGLRSLPDAPDCAALRDAVFARDFEQPALYWRHHRLAVDTYCVQHSSYVKSAKSLAAHLCGLCVALEHGNDPVLLQQNYLWLNAGVDLRKPALPDFRGRLTIADVCGIDDPSEYGRAVEAWAKSAWDAYRDSQPIAREWLALSQQNSITRSEHGRETHRAGRGRRI